MKTKIYTNYRLIILLGLFLFTLATISASSAATDVYVDTNGNDTNPGTEILPYQTINYGIQNVDNNGTVHIGAGNYRTYVNPDHKDYEITINKDVNLQGAGSDQTTIDPGTNGNIFAISPGKTVTIENLKIQNGEENVGGAIYNQGTLTIQNCVFENNHARGDGGAISNRQGTLNIVDSEFKNNYAASGYYGGAISNSNGNLTITNSKFDGNHAEYDGGAIYAIGSSTIIITGCEFKNNLAGGNGGVIYNSGTMIITGSNINQNTANQGSGGAIYNVGLLTITNNTITNNNATQRGGGIYNVGTLIITNSSITENNASVNGGGIYNLGGTLNISGSRINDNKAQNGAGIYNNGGSATLFIFDSNLNRNDASNNGGAIFNSNWATLNVTSNNIINNTAIIGGAIYIYSGTATINFNRIVSNSSTVEVNQSSAFDARYNWWGQNTGPGTGQVVGVTSEQYTPWLFMTYTADPTTIQQGQTSTLTADFRYDSNGVFHGPTLGHLPDETPVTFTTNLGNVGSKSIVIGTLNGVAIATLRGDEAAGEALTTASLDSQILTVTMTITPTVRAASETTTTETVGMQETGIPIPLMVIAILMVFSGLIGTRKK
ncbi:MAG: right-handed parallel beta-helix repeat-containing protein [Methanobacterium sp.]